ncbi:MAG: hypothetical protein V1837_00850 [Candidatus Woesearchaeota archaeon]
MSEEKEYLKEWITQFLKNRNMVFKTIESISKHDSYDLFVKHKTKEQYIIVQPILEDPKRISGDKHILVVCFNTEENFQFLLDNWKQLAACPNLTMYYVNPLSEPDKKWIISPYVHQAICDNTSLRTGLRSMFETVNPLSNEKIKSLIKKKE